jgi:hypothetical protein
VPGKHSIGFLVNIISDQVISIPARLYLTRRTNAAPLLSAQAAQFGFQFTQVSLSLSAGLALGGSLGFGAGSPGFGISPGLALGGQSCNHLGIVTRPGSVRHAG